MVRIFCLTSITKIPAEADPVEVYEYEDVNERLWFNEKETFNILLRLKKNEPSRYVTRHIFFKTFYPIEQNTTNESSYLDEYKLTEISIGWKSFKGTKVFAMYLFREDTDIIKVKMVRGAVKFIETKNYPNKDAFDFIIATSKLHDNNLHEIDFDIKIKVRCIKNTKEKYITQEEEDSYKAFAQRLKGINKELQENELIHNSLKLPNQSEANVLRTKLSDISILIRYLCDPQTGSVNNILPEKGEPTPRYCQQLSIWLKSVNEIAFENMDIFDVSLHELLYEINLANLGILKLRKCKIAKLSRKFLKMLPETMEEMCLSHNNISLITQPITRLIRLRKLDLSNNEMLTDLPWTDLPASIEELNLQNTNILIIPKEILQLSNLKLLIGNFHFVSWENLSNKIQVIHIQDTKEPINEIILTDKSNLRDLYLINAGITEIDCSKLPSQLKELNLKDNNIKHFDSKDSLPNLLRLTLDAETICWKNLSSTINSLTLSNISVVPSDISKFNKLMIFEINSKNLKSISWKDIGSSLTHFQINGGGNMLKDIQFIKKDIERVKKSGITMLEISYAGLTEIDCTKLPKKIESLILIGNNLKNFDIKNSLSKLESLSLCNNKIETIAWESLPASMYSINVNNNCLQIIGNISHFNTFGSLLAKNNKITNLCFAKDDDWSVFSRFRRLSEIDLGENDLSHLPFGFENLECLRRLLLNNNKFDCKSGNIEEELWNRLPPNLQFLNFNCNILNEIPCALKRLSKLNTLEVVDCKLTKICSNILTLIVNKRPMMFSESYMDIRKNPLIQNIPYIPLNISKKITHPTQQNYDKKTYNLMIDNLDLINISTHKIKYDFKENEEASNICKCCVKCGEENNEKPIKQLFTMDINMILELENTSRKKEYSKGKWRSNIITRICSPCYLLLKETIISEEFQTLQNKTLAVVRGKRKNPILQSGLSFTNFQTPNKKSFNILSNIPFYPLQLKQFYPDSYVGLNENQSSILPNLDTVIQENTERLPPIGQMFSSQRFDPNLIDQSESQINPNCCIPDTECNNIASSSYDHQSFIPSTDCDVILNETMMQEERSEMFCHLAKPSTSILYDSSDNNFDPRNL